MQKLFDILGLLLLFALGIRPTPEAEEVLLNLLVETLTWVLRLVH